MKKRLFWLIPGLVLVLLAPGGCTRNSEAKINVTNRSAVEIKVSINNLFTTLAAGASDTVTMTWPGRDILDVTMIYYPSNQPTRVRYQYLELNHGDVIDVNLWFED